MKVLVIDNEPSVLQALVQLIEAFCTDMSVLETAHSVKTGVEKIKSFPFLLSSIFSKNRFLARSEGVISTSPLAA